MKITTYQQARDFVQSFIPLNIYQKIKEGTVLGHPLDRMRTLLSYMGNPEKKFASILVGGTSGKGSTAYLISHILKTAEYKTGFFMKPHLQKVNERIQVNEIPITDEDFLKYVNFLIPAIEKMAKLPVGKPSYLEILVTLAFLYYAEKNIDIAVVEVGMGGEFDATNTLEPLISVITNVSLDHTEFLGTTVEEIAKTKAGIIKQYRVSSIKYGGKRMTNPIVITGVKQHSVIKIIEDRCKEVGTALYRLERDFNYKIVKEGIEGSIFRFRSESDHNDPVSLSSLSNLELSLTGAHQVENTSLAIETVLKLRKFGFRVEENDIRKALSTAFFPGRFEIVHLSNDLALRQAQGKMSATLILDGAHNKAKMHAFITSFKKLYGKRKNIFIIAFKKDKTIQGMLEEILPSADMLVITEFQNVTDMMLKKGAMNAESIKNEVFRIKGKKKIEVFTEKNVSLALKKAFQKADKKSLIVVTGSLYLVGEAREAVHLPDVTEQAGN